MASTFAMTGSHGSVSVGPQNVGPVVNLARIRQWRISEALADVTEWADSESQGHIVREAGAKTALFQTQGIYHRLASTWLLFRPGDKLFVTLWMEVSSVLFWNFPTALCQSFDMVIDIDTREVIGWQATWGASGSYTAPIS